MAYRAEPSKVESRERGEPTKTEKAEPSKSAVTGTPSKPESLQEQLFNGSSAAHAPLAQAFVDNLITVIALDNDALLVGALESLLKICKNPETCAIVASRKPTEALVSSLMRQRVETSKVAADVLSVLYPQIKDELLAQSVIVVSPLVYLATTTVPGSSAAHTSALDLLVAMAADSYNVREQCVQQGMIQYCLQAMLIGCEEHQAAAGGLLRVLTQEHMGWPWEWPSLHGLVTASIPSLVNLLYVRTGPVKDLVVQVLCNFSHGTVSTREQLFNYGVLEPVLFSLRPNCDNVQLLSILSNMTVLTSGQRRCLTDETLPMELLQALGTGDGECQACIGGILLNLARNPTAGRAFKRPEMLSHLKTLLKHPSVAIQATGFRLISFLCTSNPDCLLAMDQSGIADIVVTTVKAKVSDVTGYALQALCCLCQQSSITQRLTEGDIIPYLAQILDSSDTFVARGALIAMDNLLMPGSAFCKEGMDFLVLWEDHRQRILPLVLRLMEARPMSGFLRLFRMPALKLHAAVVLSGLLEVDEVKPEVGAQITNELAAILYMALTNANEPRLVSVMASLVSLTSFPQGLAGFSDRSKLITGVGSLIQNSDLRLCRLGLLVIKQCLAENATPSMQNATVPCLLRLIHSQDSIIARTASHMLAAVAGDGNENVESTAYHGSVQNLLEILSKFRHQIETGEAVETESTGSTHNESSEPSTYSTPKRGSRAEARVSPHLSRHTSGLLVALRQQVLGALEQGNGAETSPREVASPSGGTVTSGKVIDTLEKLLYLPLNAPALAGQTFIENLIWLLEQDYPDVQAAAARLLIRLADLTEVHQSICDANGLVTLVDLIRSHNTGIQDSAAQVLAKLAENPELHMKLYNTGVVRIFWHVLQKQNEAHNNANEALLSSILKTLLALCECDSVLKLVEELGAATLFAEIKKNFAGNAAMVELAQKCLEASSTSAATNGASPDTSQNG